MPQKNKFQATNVQFIQNLNQNWIEYLKGPPIKPERKNAMIDDIEVIHGVPPWTTTKTKQSHTHSHETMRKLKTKNAIISCTERKENHFQINEMIHGLLLDSRSEWSRYASILSEEQNPLKKKKKPKLGKSNQKSNEINTQRREVSIRLWLQLHEHSQLCAKFKRKLNTEPTKRTNTPNVENRISARFCLRFFFFCFFFVSVFGFPQRRSVVLSSLGARS